MVGEKNLLYHKYEDIKNIFKNTESWSINYTIFAQVDHIIYQTNDYYYSIPKVRALQFGEIIKFPGGEKKINIPIKIWDKRALVIDKTEERRRNLLGDSWYKVLGSTLSSPMMADVGNYVRNRRTKSVVYPDENKVFRAYNLCAFHQTKVIILGKDPYIDGSANGLAFGFKDDSKKLSSKSLDIILKEVEVDCYKGLHLDFDNTLISWAEQGVLLLNTILTVERGKTDSHKNIGWERFARITCYELMLDINPKVFLIWGKDASETFTPVYDKLKTERDLPHILVLRSPHPASDLYKRDSIGQIAPDYPNTFAGNEHFSKTNEFLRQSKLHQIHW